MKPTPMGCPHCSSAEGFAEFDIVRAQAAILSFDEAGEPVYAGESEVDWDTQDLDPNEHEPYRCDACGGTFLKPVSVSHKGRTRTA